MKSTMLRSLPIIFTLLVLSFPASGLCQSTTAGQQADQGATLDLNDYQCKDIMRLSGVNRDVAIGVLHAFNLGKKGVTTFDIQVLASATDTFIERCLDQPTENALNVMEDVLKSQ